MNRGVLIIFSLIVLALISCEKGLSFCEEEKNVRKIELVPINSWTKGKRVEIKNDSLITFFLEQICAPTDISWSTDTRGEGEIVELIFTPSINDRKIYVVYRGGSDNDIRYREEGSTYYKNDLLGRSVFALVGLQNYLKEKGVDFEK